jgi:hypothetical protein
MHSIGATADDLKLIAPRTPCGKKGHLSSCPERVRHPAALKLDGVEELHRAPFTRLAGLARPDERAAAFMAHMTAAFSLEHPEEAGYNAACPHDINWVEDAPGSGKVWCFSLGGLA